MQAGTLFAIVAVALVLGACRPSAPAAGQGQTGTVPVAPSGQRAEASAAAREAPLSPPVNVKIGHAGTFGGAPLFLAKQRGYFTAEGLVVDHEAFKVSADMVPAVATGEIHAATGAINPALFNAVSRGLSFVLVADAGSFQPGRANTSLVIRKDLVDNGRYTKLEDLRGMTVGLPGPYVVNHFLLSIIADRHGFSLDELNLTPVPMADSLLALKNGSLDAYYDVEPSPTIAERDGIGVRVLTSDQVYEGLQSSVVFYGPAMTSQPEVAKRFMVGYVRGVRDYLDAFFNGQERERAIEDVRREGIAVPREIVPGGMHPDARLTVSSMDAILDWWHRVGAVQSKPDLRAMVDEQYVDYAIQRLGPAR